MKTSKQTARQRRREGEGEREWEEGGEKEKEEEKEEEEDEPGIHLFFFNYLEEDSVVPCWVVHIQKCDVNNITS